LILTIYPDDTYQLITFSQIYGNKKITVGKELSDTLKAYDWPGNVRELEHIFERAISLIEENEELTIYNLPPYLRNKLYIQKFMNGEELNLGSLNEMLREVEKKIIMNALESNRMNITKAAKSIGIGRQNMQYRIEKLGIKLNRNEG
jgi:arginine utilization regulatory protein